MIAREEEKMGGGGYRRRLMEIIPCEEISSLSPWKGIMKCEAIKLHAEKLKIS